MLRCNTARRPNQAMIRCAVALLLLAWIRPVRAESPADKYAGIFENQKISVELRSDPQGQVTGTITLGDKKMPVKARVYDGKLVGSFDNGTRSFDFAATVVGGDMQLATGNNTIALSRKADAGGNANPLDANPLDKPAAAGNPAAATPAGAAAPAAANPPVPAAKAPGAQMLRREMVFDPYLQMNAISVLVPDQWKLGSWTQTQRGFPQPMFGISVGNSAEKAGFALIPEWNYQSGYREYMVSMAPGEAAKAQMAQLCAEGAMGPFFEIRTLPRTPREFVQNILIPRYAKDVCTNIASAKDVTLVSEVPLPDLDKKFSEGDAFHHRNVSSRFRFAYTGPDGPRETEFVCSIRSLPPAPNGTTMWVADTVIYSAPKGQLDRLMPTLVAIQSSISAKPDWLSLRAKVDRQYTQMIAQVGKEQLEQQMKNDAARMDMIHAANRQANEQQAKNLEQQSAEITRQRNAAAEQVLQTVNGTAGFKSPNDGTTLILDNSYTYQYEDNHGNIYRTNGAADQPPLDPDTSWKRLEPAK